MRDVNIYIYEKVTRVRCMKKFCPQIDLSHLITKMTLIDSIFKNFFFENLDLVPLADLVAGE